VKVLNRVVEATQDIATVEVRPSLEGKRMMMILGPRAGLIRRAKATTTAGPVAPGAGPAQSAAPGTAERAPNPPPESIE
jgi:hypothetical protein